MRHPDGLDSDAFDCSLALLEKLVGMSSNNVGTRVGCQHVVAMVVRSTLCAHELAQVGDFETTFTTSS